MNHRVFVLISLGFCLIGFIPTAYAAQVIVNGGFEIGDFTGWSATSSNAHLDPGVPGNCDRPWAVTNTGAGSPSLAGTHCFTVANPIGIFAAYNSFDGDGPQTFTLSQSFAVPAAGLTSAILSWAETYRVNNTGLPRQFNINIVGSSTVNVFNETFSPTGIDYQQLTFLTHNQDIAALLNGFPGETVQILFVAMIPETYTGSGGFGLDAVSLDLVAVPEPMGLALFGLSLVGLAYTRVRWSR